MSMISVCCCCESNADLESDLFGEAFVNVCPTRHHYFAGELSRNWVPERYGWHACALEP